jgi:hypothetical protein
MGFTALTVHTNSSQQALLDALEDAPVKWKEEEVVRVCDVDGVVS